MSGRLTILPKKTYCPWKQENVERVLRDERLERERLEREAEANRAGDREKRRRHNRRHGRTEEEGDGTTETADGDGHINLFPEAKEAELRLSRGQGKNDAREGAGTAIPADGVLPVPLGGEEASKRKTGAVPFYMRPQNTKDEEAKYEDASGSFRLGGGRTNGRGAAAADAITSLITNDQYEKREDGRKEKMDPMSRFVRTDSFKRTISTKANDTNPGGAPFSFDRDLKDVYGHKRRSLDESKKHRKKHKKKKSYRLQDETGSDSGKSGYSSSSTSCPSQDGSCTHSNNETNGRHKRQHPEKDIRNNSRIRDESSPPSKESRPRKTSRTRRRKESKRRRHRSRHRSPSSDGNDYESSRDNSSGRACAGNRDSGSRQGETELEKLRNRRRARESREAERERRVFLSPGAKEGGDFSHVGNERRYHDQFNPTLSKN